jgi:glycosyltransferase involved in cell wall biosynthesis
LPTFHENFGHVFIESWSNGCPVIISDQTPWRNLEEKGIGWDISLKEKSKFIKAIEEAASMNQEDYSRMSEAAFDFAKSFRENPAVLEANRKLFNLS